MVLSFKFLWYGLNMVLYSLKNSCFSSEIYKATYIVQSFSVIQRKQTTHTGTQTHRHSHTDTHTHRHSHTHWHSHTQALTHTHTGTHTPTHRAHVTLGLYSRFIEMASFDALLYHRQLTHVQRGVWNSSMHPWQPQHGHHDVDAASEDEIPVVGCTLQQPRVHTHQNPHTPEHTHNFRYKHTLG